MGKLAMEAFEVEMGNPGHELYPRKPIKCDLCGRELKTAKGIAGHKRDYHGIDKE